jgi:16S rRNA (guanine966-N2)-methyltransferase
MGIAREAIFNILGHGEFSGRGAHFLDGCHVLDLYAGCGALAMEAFSRGAEHVTLMDMKTEHLAIARKNIEKIDKKDNATFLRGDSSNPPPAPLPCDLVFVDPPYRDGLVALSLRRLHEGGWLKFGTVIVVEMAKHDKLEVPEMFEELKNRTYGVSRILVLKVIEGDS